MDPDSSTFQFVLLFILFILSAFFSSSETALMSFNKIKLRHMVENKEKKAILISKYLEEPDKLLTTILVGNNIVNVLASVIATNLAINLYGEKGIFVATFFVTIFLLIFSEITPKSLAAIHSEKISFLFIYIIKFVTLILSPIVKILTIFTRLITKYLSKNEEENKLFTVEEFETIISVGEKEGVFKEHEKEMLQGIIDFRDKSVKEALKTPRTQIVGIPIDSNYEQVKTIIIEQQFSRYPVYNGSLDNIVGLLYAKDLFKLSREEKINFDITQTMKKSEDIIFVHEHRKIHTLFKEMKNKKLHMGIVFDEYGGTEGLITLEDILETIVGDIEDETDKDSEKMIIENNENHIIVNANIKIHEFNDEFNTNIPNGDIETIGGFIFKNLGTQPKKGQTIIWKDISFEVLSIQGNRIFLVKIEKIKNKT